MSQRQYYPPAPAGTQGPCLKRVLSVQCEGTLLRWGRNIKPVPSLPWLKPSDSHCIVKYCAALMFGFPGNFSCSHEFVPQICPCMPVGTLSVVKLKAVLDSNSLKEKRDFLWIMRAGCKKLRSSSNTDLQEPKTLSSYANCLNHTRFVQLCKVVVHV